MGKLAGKVAVITGGTTGIGLASARLFASEGAKVVVTGSNPETLEVARKELSGVAEVIASDAGSARDVAELARVVGERHGGVDVLFLNAGIGRFAPIAALEEAHFDEQFRVNVKGPWLALKHFAPILRRGAAVVVNTSIVNELGMPGTTVYAATKAAARSLVRTAAAELADAGVRVNAVSPGPIETPIYGKLGLPPEAVKGFAESLPSQVPLKRFGRPEEIARAALFLASSDASYVTGEELVVDGGMSRV